MGRFHVAARILCLIPARAHRRNTRLDPALKPDREFLATHPTFVEVQAFPIATVYRYMPRR